MGAWSKTYSKTIEGVKLYITQPNKRVSHGMQWGIQIEGEPRIRPQIVLITSFDNKRVYRLRPGSLPGGFERQMHNSLDGALGTIAHLFNLWKAKEKEKLK